MVLVIIKVLYREFNHNKIFLSIKNIIFIPELKSFFRFELSLMVIEIYHFKDVILKKSFFSNFSSKFIKRIKTKLKKVVPQFLSKFNLVFILL